MMHVITGGSGSGKSAYAEMWLTGKPENSTISVNMAGKAGNRTKNQETDGAVQDGKVICLYLYIATMRPFGAETQKKIERHRQMRAGKGFQTLECYGDLRTLDPAIKVWKTDQKAENQGAEGILLECVSNLLADVLYREDGSLVEDEKVLEIIVGGIRYLNTQTDHLAIVTNEVHSDLQDYSDETKKYIELLGRINQELGKMADQVTEVVYGIPVRIK